MSVPKLIYEPTIHVVGRQEVDRHALEDFLADHDAHRWASDATSAGEKLCEVAGRLCYLSFANPRPGGNAAYIRHILEAGHGSVLEHAVYSFIFTGISRSLSHELVRHRAGFSFSQLSQRYVDSSDAAFVVPPALVGVDEPVFGMAIAWARRAHADLAEKLEARFVHMTDRTARRKAAREAARSILPACVETKIFATANARAIRHFLELRGSAGADAEIRRLAFALLAVMRAEAPAIFGDYEVKSNADGIDEITTPYRKV